jgi:hypothetical protein
MPAYPSVDESLDCLRRAGWSGPTRPASAPPAAAEGRGRSSRGDVLAGISRAEAAARERERRPFQDTGAARTEFEAAGGE